MSRLVAFMLETASLLAIAASGWAAETNATDCILFSESFEDADLAGRNWYDGTTFRITGDAMADKGCVEYEWHCVEAYFKLNTLDHANDRPNRDGIVRGWFDGKLVVEHTDVVLRSTDFPKMQFNQSLMAPYFGPGLLPHAQKLWIDGLAVGTERIGPLASER